MAEENAMADQVLKSASITFVLPDGDDKDDDTAISVSITSKFNSQWDLEIASREYFANGDTWEDTGNHQYPYALNVTPLKLTQIDTNVKTTITIFPNGNDEVKFGYRLALIFDDDDPNTAPIKITQQRDGIVLNQDSRTFTT